MEDDSRKLRCYGTYKYPDYALPPGTCGTSVITALTPLSLIPSFEWHDNTPTSPPAVTSSAHSTSGYCPGLLCRC